MVKKKEVVQLIKRANRTSGPIPPGKAHSSKKGGKGYYRKRDRKIPDERD